MISHNFVRGNPFENAKLQKNLRLKDETHNLVEQRLSSSPFSRNQNSSSTYQPSQSTIESKSYIILDNNQNKHLSDDRKLQQKHALQANNTSNLSFFASEEQQNLTEKSMFQNIEIQKQVENTKSVEQLSYRRCYTPNLLRSTKQYEDCQQNSQFQFNDAGNLSSNQNVNYISNNQHPEFMYQIKNRRISKRHQDNQIQQKIDIKKQDIQWILQEDKKTINHLIENSGLKNGNVIASNQINGQDLQYLLQNNYKNVQKSKFQETGEQQQQGNSSSDTKRKSLNNKFDWKKRLVSDINEQISQTECIQNENLNKIQLNKLIPLKIKCKTEGPSKRNSKEEEYSKELIQQQSNHKVFNLLDSIEPTSVQKQDDKPSLPEVIKNCGKEIAPHPRNFPTHIFSDKINYFDLLKKLSQNCKKSEIRSISTNPKSKQDHNIFAHESPQKQKSCTRKQIQMANQSPIQLPKDTQDISDNQFNNQDSSDQDIVQDLLNVTLKPKQIQINKGMFNSIKFYGRLSSVRRNKSKENARKIQEINLLQKQNQKYIQDTFYHHQQQQQQLNRSVNYFDNRQIFNQDILHQNLNHHDQLNQIQNHLKLDSNQKKVSVLSSVNSLELEPVQQFSEDFLQSFIEKQNKINTFYTRFNQKKQKDSPLKSVRGNQSIYKAESPIKINSISPQKNASSPNKNKSFVNNNHNSKKDQNTKLLTPLIQPCYKPVEANKYNQIYSKMLQSKKEQDIMPWDYSQRDSHLHDIDQYLNLIEKTGIIQG
ncbi:hypothetical protein TTHERM_00031740 (macronuclear) [Tetrahymena thermophila SB210]|uniref:Uncharacterized protein n=1 Tax=Tetrahymena thermophila (strain SB210) TaxID=312017 RepID=Q22MP8_TETTS|nr:hypothetical protein TTHERM_00031740 [Tetrahymena thermophila SB210]EAR86489.1 hypothetical protein TTHERM_00031740 [Tetrahymena thermophila SB210]|eukprot:XP_976972.1 hypothetical protein TTHERM_00031740 [Tetrahymena thermophila SB210]